MARNHRGVADQRSTERGSGDHLAEARSRNDQADEISADRVTLSTIKAAGSYHIAIIQSLPNSPVQFDDTLAAGLTMIFPTMYGWIVQIYGYSPGDAKV